VRNELKVEPRFYVAYYEWPDSHRYVSPYADQLSDYASGMFGPELYLTDERIKKKHRERILLESIRPQRWHQGGGRRRRGHSDRHGRDLDSVA